jgi:hypothetical protein
MKPDEMEPPLDPSQLARPVEIPSELERRVVGTLRARGLLRPGGTGGREWWRNGLTALAAAALLAIGFVFGTRSERLVVATGPQYLLLLYQDSTGATLGPSQRDSVVAAYVRWAAGLREEGRLVLGEELGEGMAVVPESGPDPRDVSSRYSLGGFFVVRAENLAHAVEIARGTPHARDGGRVVVRPINPT